jgi:hypothetical protein
MYTVASIAYLSTAVLYSHKMFVSITTGTNDIKLYKLIFPEMLLEVYLVLFLVYVNDT